MEHNRSMSKRSVGVEFTVFEIVRKIKGTDSGGLVRKELPSDVLPTDNMMDAWAVAQRFTVWSGQSDDHRFVVQARDVYSDGTKEAWRNVRIPCLGVGV